MTVGTHKQSVIKVLNDFGLSEKEAHVYLSLLELGIAGANEISKKAGVNRSSTYVIIEALKKRGLISMTADKKVQEYIAAKPETLLHMAEEMSEKTTQMKKKIQDLLPELRALHTETEYKPKVIVYEGDEANKISHYSTFDSPEFRIYKDLSDMSDTVPTEYIKNDAEKRKAEGTKMFLIAPDTDGNTEIVDEYKKHKSTDQFLLIPKNKFSKSGKNIGIGIYKDRVKFASAKEKFAIFIVNQAITDTLRDLFDLAWSESQRLNKPSRKPKTE